MTTTVKRHKIFINGEWQDSTGGETQEVINPATREVIAEVPRGTEEDVNRAVSAARTAFDDVWFDTTPGDRSVALWKLAQAIEDHADEFAKLESDNVGKPKAVSDADVEFSVDNLRFFAGAARVLEGASAGEYMSGYTSMIRREALGVVASIAPWNYPLMMAIWKIGPALAAGNTVVLKPSELTPLSALRLAELAAEFLPPGVLNVITGEGEPVGAGLVRHPQVNMVSLTGDVATGKEIARTAAETLKRVHLELGGKAPVIVFDDADMDAVAEAIKIGGFYNSGQDCTAACRVLVKDLAYDEFLSRLKPAVESIKVGDPAQDDELDMGPMVSQEQLERVTGFVDRARAGGATVVVGGERGEGKGYFYRPSIVTDVDQQSEIVQREVFGPVVSVQRFTGDDEAIAWANDVPYGLAAGVWTSNVSRALRAARNLKFGTVWINDHVVLASEMPHGGYKQSGYGKDMSKYSVEDYTQIKHVMAKFE
jgi:1-pyrroline dehydrogenase